MGAYSRGGGGRPEGGGQVPVRLGCCAEELGQNYRAQGRLWTGAKMKVGYIQREFQVAWEAGEPGGSDRLREKRRVCTKTEKWVEMRGGESLREDSGGCPWRPVEVQEMAGGHRPLSSVRLVRGCRATCFDQKHRWPMGLVLHPVILRFLVDT